MKSKKGVLAVIISIAGWIIMAAGFVIVFGGSCDSVVLSVLLTGVIPFALGLAAVCFGIWSIVRKEKSRIAAIIGIIFGIFLVIPSGYMLFAYGIAGFHGGTSGIKDLIRAAIEGGEDAVEARQNSLGR